MSIRATVIISPGTTPARKRRPTETSATRPKMTMGILGGKMGPMVAEAAVTATLNSVSYPPSFMALSSIWPRPAASTTAAPDIPEKIRLATVLA